MIIQTSRVAEESSAREVEVHKRATGNSPREIEIGLLTGFQDRLYAFGLAMALIAKSVYVDEVDSDGEASPGLHVTPNLRFLEEELFPRWLAEAKYIRAFHQSGNFVYIGTPERDRGAQEIPANLEVGEALPNRQGAYA